MSNQAYNPIKSVDGIAIPCPAAYEYDSEDVSATDAGRTEGLSMKKKRQGQVAGFTLSWQNIKTEDASMILKAFNPEYVTVNLLDPYEGGYVTHEYYVGNRSGALFNSIDGLWSNIGFKIVRRKAI